jgi:hypothetical protein
MSEARNEKIVKEELNKGARKNWRYDATSIQAKEYDERNAPSYHG